MSHAVMRGVPTKAQLFLDSVIDDLVKETGRSEDRHSLNRLLFKCLRDHPDRLCLIDGKTDEKLTNGEVLCSAVQTARALASRGLRVGDVAVAMAQNHTQYAALYYGALFAGVTLFNFEPILTAYEVQHYVNLTKAALVFADADMVERMKKAMENLQNPPNFIVFGDTVTSVTQNVISTSGEITFLEFVHGHSSDCNSYWPVAVDKDATPLLFTTGGSTGLGPPKVVPLTNAGLVAQAPTEWTFEDYFPRSNELMLMIFHGQWAVHTSLFITAVIYGAVILVHSENYNYHNIINLLRRYKPTWIVMTPSDAGSLINFPEYRHGDLHSINMFALIGVAPHRELMAQLKKELRSDARLSNDYGITEAHCCVCFGDMNNPPALLPPVNVFLYKLLDKKGDVVKPGEVGELHLKSSFCLVKGYVGDDEATRDLYTADGWLRTGDLIREDPPGVWHFVDRIKFIIFSGGYPVSPAEIEEVVCSVPGVSAAVVVERPQEGPAVLVVPAAEKPSRDLIKQAVKDKLNPYKHLSAVGFIDTFPRTSVGKIHRRQCAQIVEEMIANKQCY